jgi:hypothetical protein
MKKFPTKLPLTCDDSGFYGEGLDSLTVWTISDERPEFGYGQGRRPLWNERDRDAERVRDILRGAGLTESTTPGPGS